MVGSSFPRSIAEALAGLDAGAFTSEEVCGALIGRLERLEPRVNAYITVREPDLILEDARRVDAKRRNGKGAGRLAGVPLGLKDCIATAGIRTTGGSRVYEAWFPTEDAAVVTRLKAADAIIVGKQNMDELQDGSSTDNPYFGRTRNPWNPDRTAGGSSGGSGAAVAAGLCLGAVGTDAGGSIRMPAALCGVVGLKPTHGRVSRHGILPLTSTLADAGPIARTAEDAFLLFSAMAGFDRRDTDSRRDSRTTRSFRVRFSLEGVHIGVERGYLAGPLEDSVKHAFHSVLSRAEGLGATVVELEIPELRASPWTENAILYSEAATVFASVLDGAPKSLSPDVRQRLLSGRLYSAQGYVRALASKQEIERGLNKALQRVDVIAAPTLPIEDPGWSTDGRFGFASDPDLSVFERCVIPFNISGLPAVTVPCGVGSSGLPIGVQFAGRSMNDLDVLEIAGVLHRDLGYPSGFEVNESVS